MYTHTHTEREREREREREHTETHFLSTTSFIRYNTQRKEKLSPPHDTNEHYKT
jgi:hypothetical protein